jgi:pilus assembly protein Flp/PilA
MNLRGTGRQGVKDDLGGRQTEAAVKDEESYPFHIGGFLMRQLGQSVLRFLRSEEGPTAVEYAVMVALIIVVAIVAISLLGTNVSSTFKRVADSMVTS